VGDARQVLLEGGRQLSLHSLCVIDVVLEEGVPGADLVQDGEGLGGAAQVEARDVEGVDDAFSNFVLSTSDV
jgi:hypothetical protein